MTTRAAERALESGGDPVLARVGVVASYVGAYLIAELVLAFGGVFAGVAVHAVICVVATHDRFRERYRTRTDGDPHRSTTELSSFLLCFPLACVIRICSF